MVCVQVLWKDRGRVGAGGGQGWGFKRSFWMAVCRRDFVTASSCFVEVSSRFSREISDSSFAVFEVVICVVFDLFSCRRENFP